MFGKYNQWHENRLRHVVHVDQSGQTKFHGKYVLCSDVLPILYSNQNRTFRWNRTLWTRSGHFVWDRAEADTSVRFLGQCHVFRFRPGFWFFLSHDSPPPPRAVRGKKADMFERNVLLKKYRGGRQEDYMKTRFALLWDLPVDNCINFKFKVFLSYLEYIFFYISYYLTLFSDNGLCHVFARTLVRFHILRFNATFCRLFEWHCRNL